MSCAYLSIFQFRVFNLYRLIPGGSDSSSLILNAGWLTRLIAPMAFNYLLLIGEAGSKTEQYPAFNHVMSDILVVVGSLGNYFTQGFPMLLIVLCLFTLFNLYSRTLNCIGVSHFQYSESYDDQQIDEGKEIVDRERSQRERAERRRQQADPNSIASRISARYPKKQPVSSPSLSLPQLTSTPTILTGNRQSGQVAFSSSSFAQSSPSIRPVSVPASLTSLPDKTSSFESASEVSSRAPLTGMTLGQRLRGLFTRSTAPSPTNSFTVDDMEMIERSKALMSSSRRFSEEEL